MAGESDQKTMESVVGFMKEEIDRLKKELSEKVALIDKKNLFLDEKTAEIDRLKKELAEKVALVSQKDVLLEERTSKIEEKDRKLKEKDREIIRHEVRNEENCRQTGMKENQLIVKESQILTLTREVDEMRTERDRLRHDNNELERMLENTRRNNTRGRAAQICSCCIILACIVAIVAVAAPAGMKIYDKYIEGEQTHRMLISCRNELSKRETQIETLTKMIVDCKEDLQWAEKEMNNLEIKLQRMIDIEANRGFFDHLFGMGRAIGRKALAIGAGLSSALLN